MEAVWDSTAVILGFAVLLRMLLGLHSYSGAATPPRYGDYEAQRHWMEITLHTPRSLWYKNTTDNDLAYWGLDYPPLTAYQSLLHGFFISFAEPEAVALSSSRGYETPTSKVLMRWTVLSSDILVFFPAVLWFVGAYYQRSLPRQRAWVLAMVLFLPPLLLIDHGHFQFNCISLGLAVAAVAAVVSGWEVVGSILYCLSLNHKQMGLYYAPAFFAHLLGKCLRRPDPPLAVLRLGAAVVVTFVVCWWPLVSSLDDVLQILGRLAPIRRGLFEDYVANFWCTSSPLFHWKRRLALPTLVRVCALSTLGGVLPSALHQILFPSARGFMLCMLNSALSFFLFAFQVHEKSILLPLVPAVLIALEEPELAGIFAPIATFSMYPLLLKDGLTVPYAALTGAFIIAWQQHPRTPTQGKQDLLMAVGAWKLCKSHVRAATWISVVGALLLHLLAALVKPPARYPYVHDALMMAFAFVHFSLIFVYTNWKQWQLHKGDSLSKQAARKGRHRQ